MSITSKLINVKFRLYRMGTTIVNFKVEAGTQCFSPIFRYSVIPLDGRKIYFKNINSSG